MEVSAMPRRRIPVEKAKITGSIRTNPGRFANRVTPQTGELGGPPAWLTPAQAAVFEVFRTERPWLQRSDRTLVALASTILARVMAGEDVGLTALNTLRLFLAQMGGSPADLAKVTVTEEEPEDPLDHYFS
jgi:hypothetical protein